MHTLIKNAQIVNENRIIQADVLIHNNRIERIDHTISVKYNVHEINAEALTLFPGLIDDQVHFREPGLTHKGCIASESKSAVAGGVTSYMEMPNTNPTTTTQDALRHKYQIAQKQSMANYAFYIGGSNTNIEEVLKTNLNQCCGLKLFMGSSTGTLLVDDPTALEGFFSKFEGLIATHCESDPLIQSNIKTIKQLHTGELDASWHPKIRSREACFASSSYAVTLAQKYKTRLHVLHISTAEELSLFEAQADVRKKLITAEACIHHLWFCDTDYSNKGNWIKWNPAIKSAADRDALQKALHTHQIDVIATDHAPHTREEKLQTYEKAPSGGPLVQHSLQALIELSKQGVINLETIAQKAAHNVAQLFCIEDRGYIREGYFADLVLVNLHSGQPVTSASLWAQCGWSPFENTTFSSTITHTFVNGYLQYEKGTFHPFQAGQALTFKRT